MCSAGRGLLGAALEVGCWDWAPEGRHVAPCWQPTSSSARRPAGALSGGLCPAGPETVQHQPLGGGVLPHPGVLRQDAVFQNLLQRLPPGLPPVGDCCGASGGGQPGPRGLSLRLTESQNRGGGGGRVVNVRRVSRNTASPVSFPAVKAQSYPVAPTREGRLQAASGPPEP